MAINLTTQDGRIKIANKVVAKIAGMAASNCYGIVGMAARNVKDGFVHLLHLESLTKGVVLNTKNGHLIIDLHIIVEYGTNIHAIADTLISNVKYHVEQAVGLVVEKVNIHVAGVRVDV